MVAHALITGAAGGLGAAIAARFAAVGDVTLADRRADELEAVADGLDGVGRVRTQATDLRDPAAVTGMVDVAWEAGPVTVLVNAAGIYPSVRLDELDADLWDAVLDLNARAPALATARLGALVKEAGTEAVVVNISSTAANRGRPGSGPYTASKAALDGFTKVAALELAPAIRVVGIAPGFVGVGSVVNPVAESYAAVVGRNPLGRPGTPEDIAAAAFWVTTPEASWMTGSVVAVDGGSSAGSREVPLLWHEPQM